jgi:site-specific DNA-methyltransferase (adenine-specific)
MSTKLLLGDCLKRMKDLDDCSIDAVVTDPPYGLAFMGKKWDYDVPSVEIWQQVLRVLKPGGHLLAFAGTRTQHRMAVRIEDAGFEIRDMIAWVYGSGFPKSLDVSKAIDKAAGAEREVVGHRKKLQSYGADVNDVYGGGPDKGGMQLITAPTTPAAKQWQGWGTALKPALEPITVARKPLRGTVAANVLEYGTGAINVDACRIGTGGRTCRDGKATKPSDAGWENMRGHGIASLNAGRWPANLIHDGSDEVVGLLNDAARFFYCAKASKKDRGEGNNHPTVKPTALMQYLCRLVTPPNGVILDPFMGSGSTAVAAKREKFNFIGIEMQREHFETSKRRVQEMNKS